MRLDHSQARRARGARSAVLDRYRNAHPWRSLGPRDEVMHVLEARAPAERDLQRDVHRPVGTALEIRADEHIARRRLVLRKRAEHARDPAAQHERPAARQYLRHRPNDDPEHRRHREPPPSGVRAALERRPYGRRGILRRVHQRLRAHAGALLNAAPAARARAACCSDRGRLRCRGPARSAPARRRS